MSRIPYIKTVWADRDNVNNTPGTKLNATNFNKLEEGLQNTDTILSALEDTVASLQTALETLEQNFNVHVHANEAGETTGSVVIPTPEP